MCNREQIRNNCVSNVIIDYVVHGGCKLFMYNNLVFGINDIIVKNDNVVEIYCRYLTPIISVVFNDNENDIVFMITNKNITEFVFFENNEYCIDVFGNIYFGGSFIENLLIKFSKQEVYELSENVVSYIYNSTKNKKDETLIIQSPQNCIGLVERFNDSNKKGDFSCSLSK